jgi:hypothetical protein
LPARPAIGGIIALQPAIGVGNSHGEANVFGLTVLILLTVLLIIGLVYIISSFANMPHLKNLAKSEFVEVIATAIILIIFLGGFFTISGLLAPKAPTGYGFTAPIRSIFVDDCVTIATTSEGLVLPLFLVGVMNFTLGTIANASIMVMPDQSGFSVQPLFSGTAMLIGTVGYLNTITNAMILLLFGSAFLLGLIFSLFPLFLYLGIVLRTIPWTRAAGGTLLAIFVGFYIFFPILLHTTLYSFGNLVAGTTNSLIAHSGSATAFEDVGANQLAGGDLGTGVSMTDAANSLWSTANSVSNLGPSYGLINGYIADFVEPPAFMIFAIVFIFIVTFDFTDLLADYLGAPSLSSGGLWKKWL